MNDPAQLLSLFLEGTLGRSGRKKARKAARYLGSNKGLVSASGLLAAAGIAWGIYDSLKQPGVSASPGAAGTPGQAGATSAGSTWPTALPQQIPPPVPGAAAVSSTASHSPSAIPDDVLRIVRLAVSAARADGELSAPERALILEHARRTGVEGEAEREFERPHPLADIVRGVTDETARHDLYALAFTIVRADETVTGGERIYLAQLAHQLGLDAATVARLESATATAIDAAGEA